MGRGRPREAGRGARALEEGRARDPQERPHLLRGDATALGRSRKNVDATESTDAGSPVGRSDGGSGPRGNPPQAAIARLARDGRAAGTASPAPALSADRRELARPRHGTGPGRLPGRRHGPGQDRAGHRPAAASEVQPRGRRSDRVQAESARGAGLAPRELEGRARAVRALALVPDRPSLGERQPARARSTANDVRELRPGDHHLRHALTQRPGCGSTSGTSRSSTRPRRSRTRARGNRGASRS